MKMLIAGGAGYIGSITTARMLEEGHDVVVLDDLSTGHADSVIGCPLVELPISRAGEVLDDSFDLVIHFAASALVGESETTPEKYWANNVTEGLALLEAMRTSGVSKLMFSSTCATYGQPEQLPITEDTPTAPVNAYGASKLAMDMAIASYCRAHGFAAISFRYFNVAGAYGQLVERHDPETHLVPNLLRGASGDTFTLYGTDHPTRDGTAIRDYVHVLDLAQAHVLGLDVLQQGAHDIINLGSGSGSSVREVLDAVERVTGRTIAVDEQPARPGDPPELVASYRRAHDLLGWSPTHDLTKQIRDAWEGMHIALG